MPMSSLNRIKDKFKDICQQQKIVTDNLYGLFLPLRFLWLIITKKRLFTLYYNMPTSQPYLDLSQILKGF